MFSLALENFRRMMLLSNGGNRRNRNRYYMRHRGLRPLVTINKPIPDNNGIGLIRDSNEGDLLITDIDLNIFLNTRNHYCERYDITKSFSATENKLQDPKLVIRRGFPFQINIRLNRNYQKKDKISIQLAFGDRPKMPKKTLIRIPIDSGNSNGWTATLKEVRSNELVVEITPPYKCFVGVWRLVAYTTDSNERSQPTKFKEIFILFNPFGRDDEVYLEDPNERQEYVLNEYGICFVGDCNGYDKRYWEYSQFSGNILECTFYLLEESDLPYTDRGRPVLVCRRLAGMINSSNPDGGLIEGRWNGKYADGTAPTAWQGSARILQQYWKTKKTVKYGQCWVFAGVLATVCRTLGIPCRAISNLCSAHDTDKSMSVDRFYNANYEPENFMNEDTVWNFHAWNDVYMARPDLADESYGGWQALDATPQETSDGIYCCGPCPIVAIKKGDVNAKYDAPFIIAEVNADVVNWKKEKDGTYKMFSIDSTEIGRTLITKNIYYMKQWEITHLYKFSEGSPEERSMIRNAMESGTRGLDMLERGNEDVQMKFNMDKDTALGTDINANLYFQNLSRNTRTIRGDFSIWTSIYTGVTTHLLHNEKLNFVLKPHADKKIPSLTRYSEYADKLNRIESIAVHVFIEVEETNQKIVISTSFRLKKPKMTINAATRVKLNDVLIMNASFKNPLPVQLTNCILYVEGAGVYLTLRQRNVGVGQKFSKKLELRPRSTGKHSIFLNFTCNQMDGIVGNHQIEVQE